jgi:tellurite resistance protein
MKPVTWSEMAESMSNDPTLRGLSDEQVRAVIEALALTIHADNKVAPLEVAGFNHLLFDLPWLEDRHELLRSHVPRAAQKARAANDGLAGEVYAADIADRLGSQQVRERVFVMAASLAHVDMRIDPSENKALGWLIAAFGIDEPTRDEVLERLKR